MRKPEAARLLAEMEQRVDQAVAIGRVLDMSPLDADSLERAARLLEERMRQLDLIRRQLWSTCQGKTPLPETPPANTGPYMAGGGIWNG